MTPALILSLCWAACNAIFIFLLIRSLTKQRESLLAMYYTHAKFIVYGHAKLLINGKNFWFAPVVDNWFKDIFKPDTNFFSFKTKFEDFYPNLHGQVEDLFNEHKDKH